MYDIGFQALSRMVASGADIKVLVLDTQVYSNTGGQASTASFGGQVTKLSAFGKALHGRPEPRKELGRILMAHGDVYVAQTTPAHINHFYRAIIDANAYPGPAVIIAYAPCQPEHGIADDASTPQARSRSIRARSRCSPTTRGAASAPSACRSRATRRCATTGRRCPTARRRLPRVRAHRGPLRRRTSRADGVPTAEILATQADRLANWRMLQELAGLR